jgi:hypothetical protein
MRAASAPDTMQTDKGDFCFVVIVTKSPGGSAK